MDYQDDMGTRPTSFNDNEIVFDDRGPPLTRLQNLVRVAKGAALVCFLLPWVTVSCNNTPLMKVSGVQMMTGNIAMQNPVTGEIERQGGVNYLVLVAFLIIVGLLALGFIWKQRAALMTGLVGCWLALALLIYGVAYKGSAAMAEAQAKANSEMGGRSSGIEGLDEFGRNLANAIRMEFNIGYWLTLIAIAAAAVLYWMMMRGRGNFDRVAEQRRR